MSELGHRLIAEGFESDVPPWMCPVCFNEEVGIDHEILWSTEWVQGRMKPVMYCTYAGTPLDRSKTPKEPIGRERMKDTRKPCLECGIDCFWSPFDLQWSHMGWTVNGKEQPKPHRPIVVEALEHPGKAFIGSRNEEK